MMATMCHHPFQTIKTTTRDARDDNNTEQQTIDFFLSDVSDGFFGSSFRKGKIENKYYTSWLVASDDAG
jgi:hypothetical protein